MASFKETADSGGFVPGNEGKASSFKTLGDLGKHVPNSGILNKLVRKKGSVGEITPKTQRNGDSVFDNEWLKSTFIISDSDITVGDEYSKFIRTNRYYSTADSKFTSTAPGMSIGVNPKPQFTRYCDPRCKGKIASRPEIGIPMVSHQYGLGMGDFYSRAFDDNQQRIFMRFGVPSYTPLLIWVAKSFDFDKVVLHNRGIITSTLLKGIQLTSAFFAMRAVPLLSLGMAAMALYTQNTRFYSVKETMYVYWATVENILNQMVARRTMVPHVLENSGFNIAVGKHDSKMGTEQKVTSSFIKSLNEFMPGVVDPETGRISVFTVALKAQAAFNKMQHADMMANNNKRLSEDFTGYRFTGESSHDTYFTNKHGDPSLFVKYFFTKAHDLLMSNNPGNSVDDSNPANGVIDYEPIYTDPNGSPISLSGEGDGGVDGVMKSNAEAKKETLAKYQEYLLAELTEGAAFAVFNVEPTGSVGESFSNSFTDNPIESMFNSVSSKSRNLGNILSSATSIPIVGDAMKLAADAGAAVLSGASFGIANPLLALAYGVNISMPKVWENSSASLPRASYKMRLISPYGNSYSQLFNIYLPLAMILAASLPRSTGNSSYTSPFCCQLFDRGRVNSQLSMVESVNITRGTSNLGFSRNGHPNAIDIDLNIANLDEIISIDVNSNGVLTKALQAFNPNMSDNPFTSYINTVTAVDVYTQVYALPRIRLKLAERAMDVKAVLNGDPAAFAAWTVDKIPFGGVMKSMLGNNNATMMDLTGR